MNKGTIYLVGVLLLAVFALLVGPAPAVAHEGAEPVELTFEKVLVGPGYVWAGSVDGDLQGGLVTELTALEISGAIWLVEFDWIVDTGDEHSFTAHLQGILNTTTGAVVMNGVVTEGWMEGAQVHEEGQLVNPATSAFQGTIQIMTRSAG